MSGASSVPPARTDSPHSIFHPAYFTRAGRSQAQAPEVGQGERGSPGCAPTPYIPDHQWHLLQHQERVLDPGKVHTEVCGCLSGFPLAVLPSYGSLSYMPPPLPPTGLVLLFQPRSCQRERIFLLEALHFRKYWYLGLPGAPNRPLTLLPVPSWPSHLMAYQTLGFLQSAPPHPKYAFSLS